jgi:hypothetical protein
VELSAGGIEYEDTGGSALSARFGGACLAPTACDKQTLCQDVEDLLDFYALMDKAVWPWNFESVAPPAGAWCR